MVLNVNVFSNTYKPSIVIVDRSIPYHVYYRDEFNHGIDVFPDNKSNNYKYDTLFINIKKPTQVRLLLDRFQNPFYLIPGDTVKAVYDSRKLTKYRFYGRYIQELNFLNKLEEFNLGLTMLDLSGIVWNDKINVDLILEEHDKLYHARLKLLNAYNDSLKFDNQYYQILRGEIELLHLIGLLQPFFKASEAGKLKLKEEYHLRIIKYKYWLISDDTLISCYWYRFAFMSYHMYDNRLDSGSDQFFKKLYYKAQEYPHSSAQYLQFHLLHDERESRTDSFIECLDNFRKNKANENYVIHLDTEIKELEMLTNAEEFNSTFLIGVDGKKYKWGDILRENVGQVTYTDIWASWCGPCRIEIPHSIKLQKRLPVSDYTFIYISIDSDKKKWLAAINKNHLRGVKKKNYLLNPESALAKKLTPDGIPKYLLFDKTGKVVTLNAPRPSFPETLNLLINAAK